MATLSADPFLGQYEQAFPALSQYFAEVQGAASATVNDVFVSEIDRGTATAVVVADRLVTDAGGTRQESDVYIRVDLAEIDGTWKVVGVTNLNLALSSTDLGDAGDPASSTSTEPPPRPG